MINVSFIPFSIAVKVHSNLPRTLIFASYFHKKCMVKVKNYYINNFFSNRKPFHPKRLTESWLVPFFMDPIEEEEEIDVVEEDDKKLDAILKKLDEKKKKEMEELQVEALKKQKKRNATMGELLRSKGFFWIATSHDLMGAWQQAGNVLRLKAENEWMCKNQDLWVGGPTEDIVRKVSVY